MAAVGCCRASIWESSSPRFRPTPRATTRSGNYHNPGPSLLGEQGPPRGSLRIYRSTVTPAPCKPCESRGVGPAAFGARADRCSNVRLADGGAQSENPSCAVLARGVPAMGAAAQLLALGPLRRAAPVRPGQRHHGGEIRLPAKIWRLRRVRPLTWIARVPFWPRWAAIDAGSQRDGPL